MSTVLILGGYGNFGKRIAEDLSHIKDMKILIGGRTLPKAKRLIDELKIQSAAELIPLQIDFNSDNLTSIFADLCLDIVIHTGGPFQGQSLKVPEACINSGSHYIDLSDDRQFVCNIKLLSDRAKDKGVLLVSGASSVPGLSSSVVDKFAPDFSVIDSIDIAIAPGNKAERGIATIAGILSYTGHEYSTYCGGRWIKIRGWMNPRKKEFMGRLGKRWLANVDVPDLEFFPKRYSVKDFVRFQAGLELSILHFGMVVMAWIVKARLIKSWMPFAAFISSASNLFSKLGTDIGAMEVQISGEDKNNNPRVVRWGLYAPNGTGPYIPTISAIIVARKLINNEISTRGAIACMGLFTIDEFMPYADELGIDVMEECGG